MHEEDFSSSCSPTWPEQVYPSPDQSYPDEAANSIKEKWKKGQWRGSHLFDAIRARLGPQDQQAQAPLRIFDALKA